MIRLGESVRVARDVMGTGFEQQRGVVVGVVAEYLEVYLPELSNGEYVLFEEEELEVEA